MYVRVVWDFQKYRRRLIVRNVGYRLTYTWKIPDRRKFVPGHWRPLAIITSKTAITSIYADTTAFNVNKNSRNDVVRDEHSLRWVAHQFTKPMYTRAEVVVCGQEAGLTKIRIHSNIVEWQCLLKASGLVNVLPGKLFYVSVVSLTLKPINFTKLMIVTSVLNA